MSEITQPQTEKVARISRKNPAKTVQYSSHPAGITLITFVQPTYSNFHILKKNLKTMSVESKLRQCCHAHAYKPKLHLLTVS